MRYNSVSSNRNLTQYTLKLFVFYLWNQVVFSEAQLDPIKSLVGLGLTFLSDSCHTHVKFLPLNSSSFFSASFSDFLYSLLAMIDLYISKAVSSEKRERLLSNSRSKLRLVPLPLIGLAETCARAEQTTVGCRWLARSHAPPWRQVWAATPETLSRRRGWFPKDECFYC